MNILRTTSFLLALSTASALAANNPAPPAKASAPASASATVLILGDSLSSAHRIPVESGWITLLEKRLVAEVGAAPAFINASRGGKTLTDAIGELPALLDEHHPSLVVIELGANDAFLGAKGPELHEKMTRLVDMAQDSGAVVTVLGYAMPPMMDKDGAAATLRDTYATVAKEQDVSLLPSLLAGISDKPELLLDDGVHPNAKAQPLVLENAWSTLLPLLSAKESAKRD
jgi:acyl-CoA thioesterase-1